MSSLINSKAIADCLAEKSTVREARQEARTASYYECFLTLMIR